MELSRCQLGSHLVQLVGNALTLIVLVQVISDAAHLLLRRRRDAGRRRLAGHNLPLRDTTDVNSPSSALLFSSCSSSSRSRRTSPDDALTLIIAPSISTRLLSVALPSSSRAPIVGAAGVVSSTLLGGCREATGQAIRRFPEATMSFAATMTEIFTY
uniref:Uncharacterized protein n=1 Tax=Oryza punctata TaxID=4537 RepID=A0A0E0M7P6_ORYPU